MRKGAWAAAVVAALLPASGAAASTFEGTYVAGSKSYAQELRITKRADGRLDVKAEVGARACTGEVEASGTADGDVLKAEARDGNETCTLTLRRTKKGLRVEEDNCSLFHGAACEFSGDYRKR